MTTTKRYGNDSYWCFLEDGWCDREVAIWQGPEGSEKIIGRASDKYTAKVIINALLYYVDIEKKQDAFNDKEMKFLEFAAANFIEPYATMASNSILWNDKQTYNKLVNDFGKIYS